ncbi:MAG: flippase [Bacilli bacterium]|nr:flippase [Bacilli bacterium]
MKQKPKAIINYIYSSFYQLFLIIVPLITAPYLARTLLPEGTGINSYASSVVTIFSALGLIGLNNYSLREIAYVRDDKKKLEKTFSELFFLRIICFIITSIIYIIYALLSEYRLYLLIQLVALLASFIDIAWIYQGFEEFKITVTRNFIVKILNIISIFLFIKGPEDLLLFMIISSIYAVIVNFVLYFGVKDRVGKITLKGLDIKRHLIPTLKLFIPQVASMVYLQCDKMMIKYLAEDIKYVGFYDQAERLIKVPLALITALSTVMLPKVANEFKNNNQESVKSNVITSFKFSILMALPLMFGVISIANNFIPWFLGKGYTEVIPLMMILSIIVLFISLSSVLGNQYLTAINKTKILTIATISGAILNCILNFFLIPKYNAIGAAIGTIAAEVTVFAIEFYYTKEIIKIKDLISCSKNYLISGIIMFILTYSVGTILEPRIISTLIQITLGGISYFIILYILKDKFFIECLNKLLRLFKINKTIKE